MSVWAVAKKGENNEKLMKRFKQQVQSARIILVVRTSKYHKKKKTKRRVRQEAVMASKFRAIREKEKLYC